MEKEKLAWLAGITDGEGTIAVFHNKENTDWKKDGPYDRYHAIYTIANTDPNIINEAMKVLNEIGVTAQIFRRTPVSEKHSVGMHLNCRKLSHIKIVLEALLPFLVGKKAQAELTLRFVNSRLERPECHVRKKNQSKSFSQEEMDLSTKITSLNRKGRFKVSETKRQTSEHLSDNIVRTDAKVSELTLI